jgi:predicted aconitase
MSKIADSLGADELVEVVSVQAMAHFGSLHIAGRDWLEKLAAMGGQCCVPTTQDPASIPFETWEEMGFDRTYAENQLRLRDAIIKLGEFPAWSCTPYNQGSVPRFGQNVAWAESSAVSYANSVIGARTNRTPAGLAICAALIGRAPRFGLYLPENRRAQIRVTIDAGALSDLDYNTIGIILGKTVGDQIPALYGISPSVTNDNLKYLGASAASSGSVALYHIDGVTPEAITSDPFRGQKPTDELIITRRELDETAATTNTAHPSEPELVVTGCPHCSASEIKHIGTLMEGRKLRPDKAFWLFTTYEADALMRRAGVTQKLEAAGVRMMVSTCLVISPMIGNYRTLMTNSGKFASYLPSEHGVELVYASLEDCVKAVTV